MRFRTVDPALFLDEVLWEWETEKNVPLFRLLVGLSGVADRDGRFDWRPKRLRAEILPYWDGDIDYALEILRDNWYIDRYDVGAKAYGVVLDFIASQFINPREAPSDRPSPPADITARIVPPRTKNPPKELDVRVYRTKDIPMPDIPPITVPNDEAIPEDLLGSALAAIDEVDNWVPKDIPSPSGRREARAIQARIETEKDKASWLPRDAAVSTIERIHRELTGHATSINLQDYKVEKQVSQLVKWAKKEAPDAWLAAIDESYRNYLSSGGKAESAGYPIAWYLREPSSSLVAQKQELTKEDKAAKRLAELKKKKGIK